MSGGDPQAPRLGESNQGSIILLGRPKLIRELCRGQILPVTWTGWVIELLEQIGQGIAVTQRQADREIQTGGGREPSHRLQSRGGGWNMACEDLFGLGAA